MDRDQALAFITEHRRAVLSTTRRDGRPALSPVTATVEADGSVVVSSRETAYKVRHLRREPYASLVCFTEGFFGPFVQVEGPATVVSLPDAMDPLVEYYRRAAGEHPNWDDYRAAMTRERRVLIRITPERIGPTVSG